MPCSGQSRLAHASDKDALGSWRVRSFGDHWLTKAMSLLQSIFRRDEDPLHCRVVEPFSFVQPWCGLDARCFAEEKNTLPAAIKAEDPRCSSLQAFNSGALSGALEEGHEPEMESREEL